WAFSTHSTHCPSGEQYPSSHASPSQGTFTATPSWQRSWVQSFPSSGRSASSGTATSRPSPSHRSETQSPAVCEATGPGGSTRIATQTPSSQVKAPQAVSLGQSSCDAHSGTSDSEGGASGSHAARNETRGRRRERV